MHKMLDSLLPHKISVRLSHLIPCCMQRLKLGQIEGYAKCSREHNPQGTITKAVNTTYSLAHLLLVITVPEGKTFKDIFLHPDLKVKCKSNKTVRVRKTVVCYKR